MTEFKYKRRPGGVNSAGKKEKNSHLHDMPFPYPVAEVVIHDIINSWGCKIKHKPKVLDACCGYGALGFAFSESRPAKFIDFVDIKIPDRFIDPYVKNNFWQLDVSKKLPMKYDVILCNPPWHIDISEKIYHSLIKKLEPGGILFFIIQSIFVYNGWERALYHKWDAWKFYPTFTFQLSGATRTDCGLAVYINDKPFEKKENKIFCQIHPTIAKKHQDKYNEKQLYKMWTPESRQSSIDENKSLFSEISN